MTEIALHPDDYGKLRELAELLHDISSGRMDRRTVRKDLRSLVETLMVCARDDCASAAADVMAEILAAGATWGHAVAETGSADLPRGLLTCARRLFCWRGRPIEKTLTATTARGCASCVGHWWP
jgi:hypothetical protein